MKFDLRTGLRPIGTIVPHALIEPGHELFGNSWTKVCRLTQPLAVEHVLPQEFLKRLNLF